MGRVDTMKSDEPLPPASGNVKSAQRILDLLELLGTEVRGWRLTEIASELDIPKSSCLMLLQTLAQRGYVEKSQDNSWSMRSALLDQSGWVGGRTGLLRQIALPELKALSHRIAQTAVLGVLTAKPEVKVIDTVQSTADIRYEIPLGTRFPVFCSAMGRCFLAFGRPGFAESYFAANPRLPKFTRYTVNEPDTLRDLIAEIRRQRHAINIEEHVIGAASVAAPILDRDGTIVAALNVGCVTPSYFENQTRINAAVHETGLRISALLQTA